MSFVDVILYIGTFVFAVTGALKARTHQMDILGASVLAFVTAYGGGTLRDLLIGIRVGWMNDPIPLVLVATAVIVVFLFKQNIHSFENTLFFTDAVGLGMFAAGGIDRSLHNGIFESYAVLLGVMSATFGGLIADLLSNRTPSLFQKGELYATAAAVGGVVYLILKRINFSDYLSLSVCVAVVVFVRVISKRKKIGLPGI